MLNAYSMRGFTVATPTELSPGGTLHVENGRMAHALDRGAHVVKFPEDTVAFPALVNVHDHMNGNYLPRVGPEHSDYYLNWSNWERDLRASYTVSVERAKIGVEDRYLLSAFKNMFSGVITVNDHFPHHLNEPLIPLLPIRVIRDYALAHECSSFDLKWGEGIEVEHAKAVKRGIPFITHLEEGFDQETQRGVEILEQKGCFDGYDVFIHCIGFSDEDIRKAAHAGATMVWCPASNLFMFNLTCKIRKMLQAGANVAIGTDSTATGSVNLLEEMRFARETYRRLYAEDLPAEAIVKMVTVNPARAFRMQADVGSLEDGKLADILVIRRKREDPYESLVAARPEDVELLVKEGTPIFGSEAYEDLFRLRDAAFFPISVNGRKMLAQADPAGLLNRVRELVGFRKVLDFMPLDL